MLRAGKSCELGTMWLSLGAIVGYAAAGGVLVLIAIGVCCHRYRRNRASGDSGDFINLTEQSRQAMLS